MLRKIALATLVATLLAGCSSGGDEGLSGAEVDPPPPSPSGVPSARSSAVTGGEAAGYVLGEDELPDGWRHATGEQHLGVPKMCGVTLEPPALASVETQRFTRGFSGPFVIQYSFVSANATAATERVDEFVTAARTCRTYKPAAGVTVKVTPITDIEPVGEAFAAVHGVNEAASGNAQDYVVFRNGAAVTVLQSYSPATLASHDDLSAMAEAISAKQG